MAFLPSLSHSKRYTWNACRQKYAFQYIERLKVLPTDTRPEDWARFAMGILIHGAMESAFLGEPLDKGLSKAVERFYKNGEMEPAKEALLPKMLEDALSIAKDCCAWLPVTDFRPLPHPETGLPMVEAKLTVPLKGWEGGFLGYADLVAEHIPTGTRLVLDYKTRAAFEQHDMDRYNQQFALYQRVLRDMGMPVHGSLLVEIKSSVPKRKPKYVRNDQGGISGIRESADGRFKTTPTLRSNRFIDTVWEDFEREAVEIANSHERPEAIYRNMSGFGCGSCKFSRVCMARANGEDSDFIKESLYGVDLVD